MFIDYFFIFLLIFVGQINGQQTKSNDILSRLKEKVPSCDPRQFLKSDISFRKLSNELNKTCLSSTPNEEKEMLCSLIYYQLKRACLLPKDRQPQGIIYSPKQNNQEICSMKNVSVINQFLWRKHSFLNKNSLGITKENLCEKLSSKQELLSLLRFFYRFSSQIPDEPTTNTNQQGNLSPSGNQAEQSKQETQQTAPNKPKEETKASGSTEQSNKNPIETKKEQKNMENSETTKLADAKSNESTKNSSNNTTNIEKPSNATLVDKTLDLAKNLPTKLEQIGEKLGLQSKNSSSNTSSSSTNPSTTTQKESNIVVDQTKKENNRSGSKINDDKEPAEKDDNNDQDDEDDEDGGQPQQTNVEQKSINTKDEKSPSAEQTPPVVSNVEAKEKNGPGSKIEPTAEEKKITETSSTNNSSKIINKPIDESLPVSGNLSSMILNLMKTYGISSAELIELIQSKQIDKNQTKTSEQKPPNSETKEKNPQEKESKPVEKNEEIDQQGSSKNAAKNDDDDNNDDLQGDNQVNKDDQRPSANIEEPDNNEPNNDPDEEEKVIPQPAKVNENNKGKFGAKVPDTHDKDDDRSNIEPLYIATKKPKENRIVETPRDDGWSGSFVTYFLLFTLFVVIGYLILHNKNKLMGYLIEGRRSKTSRTGSRPSHRHYEPIQNVNDVIDIDQSESQLNKGSIPFLKS